MPMRRVLRQRRVALVRGGVDTLRLSGSILIADREGGADDISSSILYAMFVLEMWMMM